jgi:hypothetical protein
LMRFMMIKTLTLAISTSVLLSGCAIANTPEQPNIDVSKKNEAALMIGASVRDITPTQNMFPLHRMPKVTLAGVLDPIHVRVMALSNGGKPSLIICAETGRSLGPQIAQAVSEHTGIPLESIVNTSTHSHAAPEMDDPINFYIQDESKADKQQLWAKYALEQTIAAANEAIANLQPASVGIGYGKSYINVNRNSQYNKADDKGNLTEYSFLGYNPEGPSDKTLAALQFNDKKGKPIAFIVNYAVHGTVMHANTNINGDTGISSDIPGFASNFLEEKYKGAVAIWLSGAAADQNPIIQNNMYTRSVKTGEFEEVVGDDYNMLNYLSKIHFNDIEHTLANIHKFNSQVTVNSAYLTDTIPQNDGSSYPVTLQMLRIGDIAFAAFPGELFTTTGATIKENASLKDVLIVNHAWQSFSQSPNYWADDYTIEVDGFGANRHNYKPGYLAPTLAKMNNQLIDETTLWQFNGDGTATNNITQETVIVGLDDVAGSADDNRLISASGKILKENVTVKFDKSHQAYIDLGNGFHVYAGDDNKIGTTDDLIKGFGHFPIDAQGKKLIELNWRLLDIKDQQALLSTSTIVDSVPFNLKDDQGDEWAESNLRRWLNSQGGENSVGQNKGFLSQAFSSAERKELVKSTVTMDSDQGFVAYNRLLSADWWKHYETKGKNTQDFVWALSGEEVFNYFGLSDIATQDELGHDPKNYTNGYFIATPYSIAHGVHINEGGNGPSFVGFGDVWTRSKGAPVEDNMYHGVFLGSTGSLNSGRQVTRQYGAVPIIKVALN